MTRKEYCMDRIRVKQMARFKSRFGLNFGCSGIPEINPFQPPVPLELKIIQKYYFYYF